MILSNGLAANYDTIIILKTTEDTVASLLDFKLRLLEKLNMAWLPQMNISELRLRF